MHMDVAGTASRVAPSEEEGGAGGTRSDEEESVFSPSPIFSELKMHAISLY